MKRFLTVLMLLGIFVCFAYGIAFSSEGAAPAAGGDSGVKQAAALAAGIGLGIAALGGALGQGKGLAAALEGISRNPARRKDTYTMLIGLAMIESLVIYSLVISFLLFAKCKETPRGGKSFPPITLINNKKSWYLTKSIISDIFFGY
jgi:F-type H+-transporting ATPase subunit c